MLPSFPHGATGSPTASSPPPRAASDSRRAIGYADRKLLTMEKQPWVESLCAVIPATLDETAFLKIHNGALDRAIRSFPNSTDDNKAKPAPQPLIPIAVARQTRHLEDPPQTRPRLLRHRKRGGQGACAAQQRERSVSPGRPHQREKRRLRQRGARGSGGRSQGGGWSGRAPHSGLPLEPPSPPHVTSAEGAEHLLSAEGRRPSVVARWATIGGHGTATEGARAGQWRHRRGRAWCRRLRRGECGSRAPSWWLRRRTTTPSKRAARPAGSFGGGRQHLWRGAARPAGGFGGGRARRRHVSKGAWDGACAGACGGKNGGRGTGGVQEFLPEKITFCHKKSKFFSESYPLILKAVVGHIQFLARGRTDFQVRERLLCAD
ncbi:hypothetical protein GUJ93_ZPchr0006g43482 [Zizania palustris]|uniref:Uncharacterized protein n=1 Tax=Zizania palustris TaxID=103762 RepID=A0A8J5T1U0_ZIZPA|nr:hypothetical protein GUJ93_ZPchr0006g43482 [Zizania palustris]